MSRVVFVLGLCGSGKSTRAQQLGGTGFENFDEKATGRSTHPDWRESAYDRLLDAVARGQDCVVTDVCFLQPDVQRRVTADLARIGRSIVVEWECFDPADVEIANHNCQHDPTRTPEGISGNIKQNDEIVAALRDGILSLPPQVRLLRTVRRAPP